MTTRPTQIAILGSTGSIGCRALDVIRDLGPERARVAALVGNSNVDLLWKQVSEHRPGFVGVTDAAAFMEFQGHLQAQGGAVPALSGGPAALLEAVEWEGIDCVVVATVGAIGLRATLRAIERGLRIAIANKEVLVCAGDLVTAAAAKHGAQILPIDSEHAAIFQCLTGHRCEDVRRLLLTSSGGPFRSATLEEMRRATRAEALAHPTWHMVEKITIDSATMMNKGLEIIEAHHLFGVSEEQIDVVVHPESIVHSMVEFQDNTVLAQLSTTDMYLPILCALTWPERVANPVPPLDFAALGQLTFEEPDPVRFPCLALARRAIAEGGTAPAVLNAANEIAVAHFLAEEITLLEIPTMIERALDAHTSTPSPGLEEILAADAWARREVEALCASAS
jgi:1-deoxy-D-xylulose-5-phosphate reductoisomerase